MMKWDIYILSVLFLFAGCKKETIAPPPSPDTSTTELMPGLPGDRGAIHGYFFSGYSYLRDGGSNTNGITSFACFADPAAGLLSDVDRRALFEVRLSEVQGNVGMGNVRYNGTTLDLTGSYYLLDEGPPSLIDQQARWEVAGNAVIPGFVQSLQNEFPVPYDTTSTFQLQATKGFTFLPSEYLDRWDSVVVKISSYSNYYTAYSVDKAGGKKVANLIFTSKQLDFLPDAQDGSMLVRAFRYFHRTIQGRRYVFELSTGIQYKMHISR